MSRGKHVHAPTSIPDRPKGTDDGAVPEHAARLLMPVTVETALDPASRAVDENDENEPWLTGRFSHAMPRTGVPDAAYV